MCRWRSAPSSARFPTPRPRARCTPTARVGAPPCRTGSSAANPNRDRLKQIADTSIFDLRLSRRGRRLNKMCEALSSANERGAFKRDEDAFLSRFGLSEVEKDLVRKRDFKGLIEAGLNIYLMLKLGSATGNSLYRM